MFRRIFNKAALFGFILPGTLLACGPSFPNSYLVNSDQSLLSAPRLSFEKEINRIPFDHIIEFQAVYPPKEIRYGDPRQHSVLTDIEELRQSLKQRGNDASVVEQTANQYKKIRETIEHYKDNLRSYYSSQMKGSGQTPKPVIDFFADQIPENVPEEFKLYLEGVICYRTRQLEKAVEIWKALLNLPAAERQYRSTWAAYMIAKCHWSTDKEKARFMLRQVRQYVRDGFADSLGLAAGSYGDEAGLFLSEDQYEKAIELYLIQKQTGDRSAVPSLKYVCGGVFNTHGSVDMVDLLKNRMIRQVLIAYALTCGATKERHHIFITKKDGSREFITPQQRLLEAIEQAEIDDVNNADRFAAIAYRDDDFKRARRWMDVADMDSPISRRIRAKLLLRDGKINEAAEDLAFVARQTHSMGLHFYDDYSRLDNPYKLHSELGTLYVSQKMYIQAVDALMKGGNWIDAAYIAERVLTLEELQDYVDAKWPASMLNPISDEDGFGPEGLKAMKVRYLLARRLSRHGLFEKARPYYPNAQKEISDNFDTFTTALERANDSSRLQSERADAFWTAAWLMRHKGMEIMGTELAPDCHIYGGQYSRSDPLENRLGYLQNNRLNVPTQDEIDRAQQHPVAIPNKRFHYRYFASDLAWEAAALMENEDPELARRLCLAGTWHRDRDPKHADVFYKSLVLRCGTTGLGKEADKLRWFPKIPDTLKPEKPFQVAQKDNELPQ